ncbi:uncharacterized protein EDB93DRAFT_1251094 [Suillus bovinus]|uniref:uncharacterized protein n=1 Tax=Suillus bovinus TaxID=48563 RepID=UPI001B881967|nr:uncharacterized protein EDB93DRAFT_1251094 [Suillus bovinus]KAG2146132.1 hypothetical protein EDB93DRAFT_1251094 [Suillus bovinus]
MANIVGALFVVGANGYTVISPLGVYYTGKETYFTPAPCAYFLWPVIHLLILGTCTYQFSRRGKELIIDTIGWHLPLLDFLNVMYIYSWTNQEYKYSLVFIIFTGSIVSKIYRDVKLSAVCNVCDELFLHLPFSLYYGWTTCLIFTTAFAAFGVDAEIEPARFWTKVFVFLSLFTLQAIAFVCLYASAGAMFLLVLQSSGSYGLSLFAKQKGRRLCTGPSLMCVREVIRQSPQSPYQSLDWGSRYLSSHSLTGYEPWLKNSGTLFSNHPMLADKNLAPAAPRNTITLPPASTVVQEKVLTKADWDYRLDLYL